MLDNTCTVVGKYALARASVPTRSTGPFPAALRVPETSRSINYKLSEMPEKRATTFFHIP